MGVDSLRGNGGGKEERTLGVFAEAIIELDLEPVESPNGPATPGTLDILLEIASRISPRAVEWAEEQIGQGLTEHDTYKLIAVVNDRRREIDGPA